MTRFPLFALLSLAAATAGVAGVLALPLDADVRPPALLGVALAAASGGIALIMKRRALARAGLSAAFGALAAAFALRGVLVGIGLWFVVRAQGSEVGFIAGFFAVYVLQQVIELTWVVQASKEPKGAAAA